LEEQKSAAYGGAAQRVVVVNPEFLPDRKYGNTERWGTRSIPVGAVDMTHFGVAMTPRNSPKTDTAFDCFFGLVVVPCLGVLTVFSTVFIMITVFDEFLWQLLQVIKFPIL